MKEDKFLRKNRDWGVLLTRLDESDEEYEKYICGLGNFVYAIFQRHNGVNVKCDHIHLLIRFSKPIGFTEIKSYFPNSYVRNVNFSDFRNYFVDKDDVHEIGICNKGEKYEG